MPSFLEDARGHPYSSPQRLRAPACQRQSLAPRSGSRSGRAEPQLRSDSCPFQETAARHAAGRSGPVESYIKDQPLADVSEGEYSPSDDWIIGGVPTKLCIDRWCTSIPPAKLSDSSGFLTVDFRPRSQTLDGPWARHLLPSKVDNRHEIQFPCTIMSFDLRQHVPQPVEKLNCLVDLLQRRSVALQFLELRPRIFGH